MNRFLNPALIIVGTGSGLIGNYSSSTPDTSKLLPPGFAFAIWGIIYLTGLYLAYKLLRQEIGLPGNGIFLISLGYFLSGLWIRFDGHAGIVAILAVLTLVANISAIKTLKNTEISRLLLNLLATFAGWITVATSLVIADAFKISTASDQKVAIYLAVSLSIACILYLSLVPVIGYIATIAWATLSLLFSKSTLGAPGFWVSAVAFALTMALLIAGLAKMRSVRLNA